MNCISYVLSLSLTIDFECISESLAKNSVLCTVLFWIQIYTYSYQGEFLSKNNLFSLSGYSHPQQITKVAQVKQYSSALWPLIIGV